MGSSPINSPRSSTVVPITTPDDPTLTSPRKISDSAIWERAEIPTAITNTAEDFAKVGNQTLNNSVTKSGGFKAAWAALCKIISNVFKNFLCCLPKVKTEETTDQTETPKPIKFKATTSYDNSNQVIETKNNLIGVNVKIKPTALHVGDKFSTHTSVPEQFGLDMDRRHTLYVNGKAVSKDQDSLAIIEEEYQSLINALGANGANGAARILHQGSLADPLITLMQEQRLGDFGSWGQAEDGIELSAKVKGDLVILTISQVLAGRIRDEDGNAQDTGDFVGLQTKVAIKLEELQRLGDLDSEGLAQLTPQNVQIEGTGYMVTKTYDNPDDVQLKLDKSFPNPTRENHIQRALTEAGLNF